MARRRSSTVAQLVITLAVSARAAVAQRSTGQGPRTPRLLIVSLFDGDFRLGNEIVDSAAAIIRRTVPHSALYVISKTEATNTFLIEEPPPPWPLGDVRALAKQLAADVVVDVGAWTSPRAIQLRPSRIMPHREPTPLPGIDAADVAAAAGALARVIMTDTTIPRGRIEPPCPTRLFSEREVDQTARYISRAGVRIHPVAHRRAFANLVQFDVDASGRALASSFHVLEGADSALVRGARSALPRWRFVPATAGRCKVASVVVTWIEP